jgi:anti-anti-sigma factor
MEITTKQESSVLVIALKGRMDAVTAPFFDKAFAGWVSSGSKDMLINLGSLDYISSAGLRSILSAAKQLKIAGGSLHLAALKDAVKEVVTLSGFYTILQISETEEEALQKLR